ncbi:MAG: M20 family metallopeptidase [Bacteroidota bacterium]
MDEGRIAALIKIRRQIHQNPELGYQEEATAKLVCEELDQLGIKYQAGLAKTGIVAEIDNGPGKCIALRADMDALPIQEATGLDFSSAKPGVMHACGHDVHTTILLGAVMELQASEFKGKIKFVFQPSEEGVNDDPDKKSGGQRLVEAGILDDVDQAIGLHVHPLLEVGHMSYALGDALACTGHFTITVVGKSGHAGAAPHLAKDAILISSSLVQNLNTIVSRNIDPTKTGVVSVTTIHGGVANNIVADRVEIGGTIRALDLEDYRLIISRMQSIINGTAATFDAEITMSIDLFYPSLVNDATVHDELKEVADHTFPQGVSEIDPILGGEDFAFYSRRVPSMFYFLGAKDNAEECYFLHHPKMVINEGCIPYGVSFLRDAALKLLA